MSYLPSGLAILVQGTPALDLLLVATPEFAEQAIQRAPVAPAGAGESDPFCSDVPRLMDCHRGLVPMKLLKYEVPSWHWAER